MKNKIKGRKTMKDEQKTISRGYNIAIFDKSRKFKTGFVLLVISMAVISICHINCMM